MEFGAEFAKQGLGYLIAAIEAGVIIYLYTDGKKKEKDMADLQEKRLADANTYTQSFITVAKEMVGTQKDQTSSTSNMQKSLDTITGLLQDLFKERLK